MASTTQKLTRLALLTAAAAVLGYVENLLAAMAPLPPGIKLGLANTVLLYSVYLLGPGCSAALMLMKVVLTGYMSGNLAAAFFYSLSGGALSLAMMLAVKHLGGKSVSIIGVSVVGAVFHNVGQLLAAAVMLRTPGLLFYLFPLLLSAVVMGIVTGLVGRRLIQALGQSGAPGPGGSREDL